MSPIVSWLWLVPALPLAAAAVLCFLPDRLRRFALPLAGGAMGLGFLLSCAALSEAARSPSAAGVHNFLWLEFGGSPLMLGWILDPLSAAMLAMVTFVGFWIFVFSAGYMAHDPHYVRFFCFLSLFASAMLGVVMANSLLLLFMCWEVMGLASYLLIGFWFHKPSAAAAAKKAFITTRIGDIGFLLGMVWLYGESGTLLFYDQGAGCLETSAIARMAGHAAGAGMMASTGISLLLFAGAVGKSGQIPLHVWLPDAMEGPTPVSALIHAATMVAAGVFLMARVYPIASALPPPPPVAQVASVASAPNAATPDAPAPAASHPSSLPSSSHEASVSAPTSVRSTPLPALCLRVMAWVGALTALFAALTAVAQTDIKRILAYSTVSQLGFMFLGLATGGVAVGMFHLLTHAFFKALLFLGAGSVIHGCHDEQDIRAMGGLRRWMPTTFVAYAIGMMALAGVPLFFSGFWSKDEILHAAALWSPSKWPFIIGVAAAFLTAFYMTRQMVYVYAGEYRGAGRGADGGGSMDPHESPSLMTIPLGALAACAILLSVLGTPVWPWFHAFLSGHAPRFEPSISLGVLVVMFLSVVLTAGGIGLGLSIYARAPSASLADEDPLEAWRPGLWQILRNRFYIDELYESSFIAWHAALGRFSAWLDDKVLGAAVESVRLAALGLAWGFSAMYSRTA
ncbi:MAG: NADH-quinone oxidoreductase subunit L [Verrucomicrobia bacterium]|nr:NADH-quinone oxidoreductase subunit L [Verrucomicrobiota bacterium]